jgi:Type IV secretion system pilin
MKFTQLAAASDAIKRLQGAGSQAGYQAATNAANPDYSLISIITTVINAALGLTGVIFLALIVFAGYKILTAGGDSDKVETAKETITRAVIGLTIVLLAYGITAFVVPAIFCATGNSAACAAR